MELGLGVAGPDAIELVTGDADSRACAGAATNAIFAATGIRVRTLPINTVVG